MNIGHRYNRRSILAGGSILGLASGIGISLSSTVGSMARLHADDPISLDASTEEGTDTASVSDGKDAQLLFDSPKTVRWKFGLVLKTPTTCTDVFATFVIPKPWPEQTVTPVTQNIDPAISGWEVRELPSPSNPNAHQVALRMNRVMPGSTTEISFEFDVTKSHIHHEGDVADLMIPKKAGRDLRVYMGNSPNIDASNGRIKKATRELAETEVASGWQRVEQIYDYVRENVRYVEGPIRNASDALRTGEGDCEDMTSLFVAMCRNLRIPARMVWIPDHCYPEFYLEDTNGKGIWFPCQAAGDHQFGQMEEDRPILQKGDRFKVEEHRSPVRYISEFFKCDRKGSKNPSPIFIRESVVNDA